MLHDLGDTLVVFVVFVEGQFVADPQADKEGDGQADGEAGDVEEAVQPAFGEVAEGCFEVVSDHTGKYLSEYCRIGKRLPIFVGDFDHSCAYLAYIRADRLEDFDELFR